MGIGRDLDFSLVGKELLEFFGSGKRGDEQLADIGDPVDHLSRLQLEGPGFFKCEFGERIDFAVAAKLDPFVAAVRTGDFNRCPLDFNAFILQGLPKAFDVLIAFTDGCHGDHQRDD